MKRLYVRKEIVKRRVQVSYDGKALNDALSNCMVYPLMVGVFAFVFFLASLHYLWRYWPVSLAGLALSLLGFGSFFKYLGVWIPEDDKEVEEEKLYVELPR